MNNDALRWFEGEGAQPAELAGVLAPTGDRAVHWRRAVLAERCAAIVAAARAGELGHSDARDYDDPDKRQVRVYGCAISPSDTRPGGPRPEDYHAAASDFRGRLAAITEPSFPDFFLDALRHLAGTTATVPTGPRGPYGSCTVRHLIAGTALPPHCEHLYAGIDVYRDLRELGVDLERQLSFFVVLEAPSEGGVLRVDASRSIPPVVGDLLVFPSGTTIHEVTPVAIGERWTIGGFAAFDPRGEPLYAWG
ncbi:MAG TPA: 2OG-Fe(II) oxygenase [Polyangiaceae bacterium]|nr:2OG-Fe(II) oxygenase [Polyangiaceae bacterium]